MEYEHISEGTPEGMIIVPLDVLLRHMFRPGVITLCGSTRFKKHFREANKELTLHGYIVLSVGSFPSFGKNAQPKEEKYGEEMAEMLDELHKRKIDMSDGIHVLNVHGYVGKSTASEVLYAMAHDKAVTWHNKRKRLNEGQLRKIVEA